MRTSKVPLFVLRALLLYAGVSHVVIGGGAMLSADFQGRIAELYGVTAKLDAQSVYLARVLGAFMLALGAAALVAVRDPVRYDLVVYAIAGVLLLRDLQRLIHQDEITRTFGVSAGWNLTVGAFLFAQAIAMLVLLLVVRGRAPAPEAPRPPGETSL